MDLTTYKSRDLVLLNCLQCKKTFSRTKHQIQRSLRKQTKFFCSKECSGGFKDTRIIVECLSCGSLIYSSPSKGQKFCTQSCSASFSNKQRKIQRYCLHCGVEINSKKFCSVICQTEYAYKSYIDRWKQGLESGVIGKDALSTYIRRYMFEKHNNKCQGCKWAEIHTITGKIPLTVDHIDGNALNNKEENLRLFCPNCHSLTPTYGSLNKGSGRKARYMSR